VKEDNRRRQRRATSICRQFVLLSHIAGASTVACGKAGPTIWDESTDMISEPSRRIRVFRPYYRNISVQGFRFTDKPVRSVISTKLRTRMGMCALIGERMMKSGVGHPETSSNRHTSGRVGVRTCLLHLKTRDSSQPRVQPCVRTIWSISTRQILPQAGRVTAPE
jgi:hypothetical protein